MRVATCTTVDFPADSQFFGRDTGLLCRGFQNAGVECVVVMPGKPRDEDPVDVIRCGFDDLSDPSWWCGLNLDLVVLYAWGNPRYQTVAEAIGSAGIFLVQNLDTEGINIPFGNFKAWWSSLSAKLLAPQYLHARLRLFARALRDLFPFIYEKKRIGMIDCCDRLALVSPPAAASITRYATALGHLGIGDKVLIAPHPVSNGMQPGGQKTAKVLVVGRWRQMDRAQKDPDLTMAVLEQLLKSRPDWIAEVVGSGSRELGSLTKNWTKEILDRLTLTEAIPRDELVGRYQSSRILLCCSRFESFHIASAEALCCGCSIVVADHPLLGSTAWFTTKDSGTIAKKRDISSFLAALLQETDLWETGKRSPERIADNWIPILHAHNVAKNILTYSGLNHPTEDRDSRLNIMKQP
jgi:glycosyltransferase involved in cell wall biosynthesis